MADFGDRVARSGARGYVPKAELSGAALSALLHWRPGARAEMISLTMPTRPRTEQAVARSLAETADPRDALARALGVIGESLGWRLGSGLRGLADRVAALDGKLAVIPSLSGGTVLRVELPCES